MGLFVERFEGNSMNGFREYTAVSHFMFCIPLEQANKIWQHPWHLVHRAHLHRELRAMATSNDGKGGSAQLHLSSRVKKVDPGNATITLHNGQNLSGDVVSVADGLPSRTLSCGWERQRISRGAVSTSRFTTQVILLSRRYSRSSRTR